ncbi:DNA-binding response regulator [Clostridia bacterium]|nr:DNA-binding response regulator [Clostridia bacterium]
MNEPRIAICDDELVCREQLATAVRLCSHWRGNQCIVDLFESTDELSRSIQRGVKYDYIFLDIEIGDESGLELFRQIENFTDAVFVFVSSHMKYIPQVKRLSSTILLNKPFSQEIFNETVETIYELLNEPHDFVYHIDGREYRVDTNEILFFKSESKCLKIQMLDEEKETSRLSLSAVEARLSGCGFFKVHKSYLLNLKYYKTHEYEHVFIKSNLFPDGIPMTRKLGSQLKKAYLKYSTGVKNAF